MRLCPICHGTGKKLCQKCLGSGKKRRTERKEGEVIQLCRNPCSRCNGTKRDPELDCGACNGEKIFLRLI